MGMSVYYILILIVLIMQEKMNKINRQRNQDVHGAGYEVEMSEEQRKRYNILLKD